MIIALYYWRRIRSTQRKLRYVFDATLSNDFSYKFNGSDNINTTLNAIVDHLHALTAKAQSTDAYYGLILDQAVTGIIIADEADNVTHANSAAMRLLNMEILTHLSQLQRNQQSVFTALSLNLNSCTVGNKVLSIAVTATNLDAHQLRIIALNDISGPLQSKEEESWVKLTRVLTHEIMNSLTPVNSITTTLIDNCEDVSKASLKESLLTISRCNKSLLQFVENFRKFTVIPAPKPTAFEALPFLQSVVNLTREYSQGIGITLSVSPPEMMIYADENMMHQVMINLVKNAIEAQPRVVKITAVINSDESISISVENDGPIIPEDIAEHIFVPFFTTRKSGSGIGLSLSRRYATANGATLTLQRLPHTRFIVTI